MRVLGVDTGGTFTDFVVDDDGELRVHKVLSTPTAPERAILDGIEALGLRIEDYRLIHGSTVATNAVLEGTGARTAFITNHGLGDVLTIGRQARRALYDLQPPPVSPPVPEALCIETGGRLGADAGVVEPLTDADLDAVREALERLAPEAVAIDLLFSFLDDRFERAVAAAVPDGIFVSRSSAVLAEYREYERGIATWLNAYVGPRVQGYLRRLGEGVAPAPVAVMQSAGGTISAEQAGGKAVQMLLSGPAGGLMGARFVAAASGRERLMTFDMGGTSTDVALIDGEIRLTTEGHIGPYPVGVPQADMHTIGAGGGSIASLDPGGLLLVGPRSAGADPGPACYGRGGTEPTVTDANLVLGRLQPDAFLGGAMQLDERAGHQAVGRLAEAMGCDTAAAAEGIVRVANEHMAQALRVISVQRGIDPRQFTLLSFGGAGGLHVCALAEALGMGEALIPVHAGVLSALGMLTAPRARQRSHTVGRPLAELTDDRVETRFAPLREQARRELTAEGVPAEALRERPGLDLRYRGQTYTLTVDWQGTVAAAEAFHAAHETRFGHRLDAPVELVNLRLGMEGPPPAFELPPAAAGGGAPVPARHARAHGVGEIPVYARRTLGAGHALAGPALVTEPVASTFVAPGWRCEVDRVGNLILRRSTESLVTGSPGTR